MNPTTCPHCGDELPPGQIVTLCPKCGKEVRAAGGNAQPTAQRSCPKCNYVLAPFEQTCPRCGAAPQKAADDGQFRPVQAEAEEEEEGVSLDKAAGLGPPLAAKPAGPPLLSSQPSAAPGPPLQAPQPPPGAPAPPPAARAPAGDLRPLGGGPAQQAGAGPATTPEQPWGPPPATGYQRRAAPENTSGTGGAVPSEVMGWNWGAFFLNWIWGIAHNVWISLLAIPLGLIMSIVLGVKGSEWAWQNRRFASVDEFKSVQRVWGWVGFAVFMLQLALGVVWIVMAFFVLGSAVRDAGPVIQTLPPPSP